MSLTIHYCDGNDDHEHRQETLWQFSQTSSVGSVESDVSDKKNLPQPKLPDEPYRDAPKVKVPLVKLAWGRSGDKGDKANIGIIARDRKYIPYIWHQLDENAVAYWFGHFLKGNVERYYMPGLGAINYVLDRVLDGGGIASLRNDPQAKGYAQILLEFKIEIPVEMAGELL